MFFFMALREAIFYNKKQTALCKTACFKLFVKWNYLTSSLNFLPAEKAGTVLAAIFKAAPV